MENRRRAGRKLRRPTDDAEGEVGAEDRDVAAGCRGVDVGLASVGAAVSVGRRLSALGHVRAGVEYRYVDEAVHGRRRDVLHAGLLD